MPGCEVGWALHRILSGKFVAPARLRSLSCLYASAGFVHHFIKRLPVMEGFLIALKRGMVIINREGKRENLLLG